MNTKGNYQMDYLSIMVKEFVTLLKSVSEALDPSGFRYEVRELVIMEMEPYVNELEVDKWGNVISVKYGGRMDLKAMVATNMDEIGLPIDSIDKNGFLRFRRISGWNEVVFS